MLSFWDPSQAIAIDLSKRCIAELNTPTKTLPLGPYQLEKRPVRSWFGALLTGSISDRKAGIEFNAELDRLRKEFDLSKDRLEKLIAEIQGQISTDIKNQHLKGLAEQVLQEILIKKDKVTLTEEFEILSQKLLKETQNIADQFVKLNSAIKASKTNLVKVFKKSPRRYQTRITANNLDQVLIELDQAKSLENAQEIYASALITLNNEISAFREAEQVRQKKEKRFPVELPNNSTEIVHEYGKLIESFNLGLPNDPIVLKEDQVAQRMELDLRLKVFIYRELQVARRLLNETNAQANNSIFQAMRERVRNNQEILIEYLNLTQTDLPQNRSSYLGLVDGLRLSIRYIDKQRIFSKIGLKASLNRVTGFYRELLLREALKDQQLALVIIGSTVSLPPIAPKPSVKPTKPDKPQKVTVSRSASRSSKISARNRNKENKKRYINGKNAFAQNIEKYRIAMEAYKKSLSAAKEAEYRRSVARQSLYSFIVAHYPDLVRADSGATADAGRMRDLIQENQRSILERRLSRMPESHRTSLNNHVKGIQQRLGSQYHSSENDGLLNWILLFYTGNPLWVINSDFAKLTLFMDVFAGTHFNFDEQDGASGLSALIHSSANTGIPVAAASFGETDSTGGEQQVLITDQAKRDIDQIANEHPEYTEILDSTRQQTTQDVDLNLGGRTYASALQDGLIQQPQQSSDELDRTEMTVDHQMGLEGKLANGHLEAGGPPTNASDWNSFVGKSDSPWAGDGGTGAETENDPNRDEEIINEEISSGS
ncbi:MAG: hypothetical protein IPJ71_15630 [Bdellovibrionales bacterium]|nr:hypothetical protein [Bdellovibrionales bacterium]